MLQQRLPALPLYSGQIILDMENPGVKTFISTFRVTKMDCPSEEQMIRMKLAAFESIVAMQFDIPGRSLKITHSGDTAFLNEALASLGLDSSLVESVVANLDETVTPTSGEDHQRKLLIAVLAINFFFFVLEMVTGVISRSMGLVADSLDMLADAIVYGLALWAVGSHLSRKKNVAKLAGYFQLFLAILGFAEVIRRFVTPVESPDYLQMITVSFFALLGNTASLLLLNRSHDQEAHIQASKIFTSNDVIANAGVILAGLLVYFTNTRFPDLAVGGVVFYLVLRGAIRILNLAK